MCGVIGQTKLDFSQNDKLSLIPPALHQSPFSSNPEAINYNIWTGMYAYVVSADQPEMLQTMQFGLTPFWAKKKMYFFNARSEGKLNKENNIDYKGELGIFKMPSFRAAIRHRRCLIPVDYIVEGTVKNKLAEPFLVKQKDEQPFLLGGIWEEWTDKDTGEILRSFSIITTPAATLLQKLPHHRSPLIIQAENIAIWVNENSNQQELSEIMKPADTSNFEAYPISDEVKKRRNEIEVTASLGKSIQE